MANEKARLIRLLPGYGACDRMSKWKFGSCAGGEVLTYVSVGLRAEGRRISQSQSALLRQLFSLSGNQMRKNGDTGMAHGGSCLWPILAPTAPTSGTEAALGEGPTALKTELLFQCSFLRLYHLTKLPSVFWSFLAPSISILSAASLARSTQWPTGNPGSREHPARSVLHRSRMPSLVARQWPLGHTLLYN